MAHCKQHIDLLSVLPSVYVSKLSISLEKPAFIAELQEKTERLLVTGSAQHQP
jgi:hypothetical protein